ncbi:LexA family protein [Pararhizobium arenae]|uniref:LexA family protein n=1 Tax=Pararhizobium arenae TaxID=1856850 RepID=UPI003CCA108C
MAARIFPVEIAIVNRALTPAHESIVLVLVDGEFTIKRYVVRNGPTILHHDPVHNHPHNVKAFCQRCHILHDWEEHRRRRRLTLSLTRALGDHFTGRYRPS